MRKRVGAHAAVETGASTGVATTVLALLSASALASFGLVSANELAPSPVDRARAGSESAPLQPPASVVITPPPSTVNAGDPARTDSGGTRPGVGILVLPASPALQPSPAPSGSDGAVGRPAAADVPAPSPAVAPDIPPVPGIAPGPGPVVVALPEVTVPTSEVATPSGALFSTQPVEVTASPTKVRGTKQSSGGDDGFRDDSRDGSTSRHGDTAKSLQIVDQRGEGASVSSGRESSAQDLRVRSLTKRSREPSKSKAATSKSRRGVTSPAERSSDPSNTERKNTAPRASSPQDNGHRHDRARKDRDGRSDRRDRADTVVVKSRDDGGNKGRPNVAAGVQMPGDVGRGVQVPGDAGRGVQVPGDAGQGVQVPGDVGRGDQDRDHVGRGDQDRDHDGDQRDQH
jgi:hypothetical protein